MRSLVLLLLAALAVTAVPAASAAVKAPQGARKLGAGDLKRIGAVVCGRVQGTWHPGTITKSGHFLTLRRQSQNLKADARRLKGKARTRKLAAAKRLAAKADARRATCRLRPGTLRPAPYPTPAGWPGAPAAVNTDPLRFDLRGAVGLALRDGVQGRSGAPAGSNLSVVDDAGVLHDAVSSGSVAISRFLIAPSNKVYVLFPQRTNLQSPASYTGTGCLLAEVDPATGVPACIDDSLDQVSWEQGGAANPAVQFDDRGAIYYLGWAGGRTVLRRWSGGVRTDLITDNAWVSDFLVLGDGTVVLTGSTASTTAPWVRRISPAGSLQTLRATQASFLREFPDGNVYLGLQAGGDDSGVRRYLSEDDALDPQRWIGSTWSGTPPRFSTDAICSDWNANQGFCSGGASVIKQSFRTTDGKVFVIAGSGSVGQLMQYFPTLERPTTAVRKVAVARGIVTNVVLSGLDASDRNTTTIYDTSSATETELIGPGEEHEVYHLEYVANGNRIMFDGLRFSDNRYVLGQIDLDTGEMTSAPLPAGRFSAFQTFR